MADKTWLAGGSEVLKKYFVAAQLLAESKMKTTESKMESLMKMGTEKFPRLQLTIAKVKPARVTKIGSSPKLVLTMSNKLLFSLSHLFHFSGTWT